MMSIYFKGFLMILLIFILSMSFLKKSFNILLFLLTIEMGVILFAYTSSHIFMFNFIILLMIGVLEAVLGLTLLLSFIRFFGNDQVFMF